MNLQAHRLFFALALLQGALSVPFWLLVDTSGGRDGLWHAHEMVFGYGLAVVAGFLLTRMGRASLLLLAGFWVAARIAAGLELPALLPAGLALASTAGIALSAAATFLRGTKRGGNLVFPILMLAFLLAEALFQSGGLGLWPAGARAGAWLGLGALFMLIAAMGGRTVGAAASGALQRQGGRRLPPRLWLERVQLLTLTGGMLLVGFAAVPGIPGLLPALAGAVTLLRVALWLPGLARSLADIRALAVGQVWLGLGLIAFGAALVLDLPLLPTAALHLATIGGIGTTTLVMMIRSTAQRDRKPMPPAPILLGVLVLTGAAALLRAFGGAAPEAAYAVAALLWALACLLAAWPGGIMPLAAGGKPSHRRG